MSCAINRVITFNDAIQFSEIILTDLSGNDITNDSEFSWSGDKVCWSDWVDYDSYCRSAKNIESDFYLRILISGGLGSVSLNGNRTNQYKIQIQTSSFSPVICDSDDSTTNIFQPYSGLDCALLLQQQLTDSIICMFGIPAYYFRVEPIQESRDLTFKEFTLHNITAVKQIKILAENGSLPSSRPILSQFEFGWELDWNIEISKTTFATAFGDTAVPKQRDILWVPLLKRMYEVNSAYDEKQDKLLWRSTTWSIFLRKYEENINMQESDYDTLLDSLLVKKSEVTGLEKEEQSRLTSYNQIKAPDYAAHSLTDIFISDNIRQSYTTEYINILNEFICDSNNIIARNSYEFTDSGALITYQKSFCGDSGTISVIVHTPKYFEESTESFSTSLLEFGPIQLIFTWDSEEMQMTLTFEDFEATIVSPDSTYLVIFSWDKTSYSVSQNIYYHTHPTNYPVYYLKPEQYYFLKDNPVSSLTDEYNNDYDTMIPQPIYTHGWPCKLTNIKYYNRSMDTASALRESLKYITTDPKCVLNDVARPINSGRGFSVR